MRDLIEAQQIEDNFNPVNYLFPRNARRKNASLAVSYCLDKNINVHDIIYFVPYGGLMGPGKSGMDSTLNYFKIFRLHAVFHDAFGFMGGKYNGGPGYVYVLTE